MPPCAEEEKDLLKGRSAVDPSHLLARASTTTKNCLTLFSEAHILQPQSHSSTYPYHSVIGAPDAASDPITNAAAAAKSWREAGHGGLVGSRRGRKRRSSRRCPGTGLPLLLIRVDPSRFRRRVTGTKRPNNRLAHTHTGTHQGGETGHLRHVTPALAARAVDAVLIHRTDQ